MDKKNQRVIEFPIPFYPSFIHFFFAFVAFRSVPHAWAAEQKLENQGIVHFPVFTQPCLRLNLNLCRSAALSVVFPV